MDRLTTSQIADFNNPLAFSRPREERVGQAQIQNTDSGSPIRTDDIEASFRLVTGAAERLETLEGNLNTMLELARSARFARGDERKLQETYGKLRSLSAGFDQVVEAIRFSDQALFEGETAYLDLGSGARPIELDVAKLKTYGEDSLNLSEAEPSARASVSFRTEDRIVNETYDIVGLDIDEASYVPGANPALELENGTYKIGISYAGAGSSVEIRTPEGAVVERKENVDLSGSGREWVDFDSGVRLSFEKENFFSFFDKFDFETNGPAELTATLTYERVEGHVLRTGEASPEDSVNIPFSPVLSDASGSLTVSDPRIAPVDVTRQALESGFYTLDIEYQGENSIARLTDSLGRLKAFDFAIDLSGEGSTQLDLGVGLSLSINKDQFSTEGASLTVPIDYQRQTPPIEDFDFREYANRIEEAITIVQEQRGIIDDASERIQEVNQLRNSASTSGLPSVGALNASGALSILSGEGANSLFSPASSSARLDTLSNQLFSATTALPVQANQSPQELASLQNTAATNSWLGNFA
ncbi:MAG: hypothetical protein R6V45_01515 [Oceanipulchritudo sp.]